MLLKRENLAPLVAELLGTFTLTFAILSVSKSAIGIPYFVAIGAGLTLAILVFTIGASSGAHVNPAVTFGLWSLKKINTLKALLYIVAQFMGAAFAWKLYTYLVSNTIPSIAGKDFSWEIFVAEMVGTLIFTFGIAAALYQKFEGGKLAATIGGSLIIGIVVASSISNGVVNPAVALGIQSWSKEYVIAPLVGGLLGFNLYAFVFSTESFSFKPRLARGLAPRTVSLSKSKTSAKTKKSKSKK